jgi:hypothetical protein
VLASTRTHDQDVHARESRTSCGCFKDRPDENTGFVHEPGIDRHEWESEWEALEPLLEDSPAETLSEVADLIERMLVEEGYPLGGDPVDDEGIDPEVLASSRAAREITNQVEAGENVDPGDIGHAVRLYRELYDHLLLRKPDSD